jgi:hypothetical protein
VFPLTTDRSSRCKILACGKRGPPGLDDIALPDERCR